MSDQERLDNAARQRMAVGVEIRELRANLMRLQAAEMDLETLHEKLRLQAEKAYDDLETNRKAQANMQSRIQDREAMLADMK